MSAGDERTPSSVSLVQLLTPEEEAAILAEYGVQGLDDDLLPIPAVSQFCSEYGNTNVFLTGGVPEEEDEVSQETVSIPDDELRHYPLDSLLYKRTNILGREVPVTLTSLVSNALDNIRGNADGRTVAGDASGMQLREVLRRGREEECRAFLLTQGTPAQDVTPQIITGMMHSSNDAGDDTLLKESDCLLKQADALLLRTHVVDRHADPMLLRDLEAIRLVEEVFTHDAVDVALEKEGLFGDDETVETLAKARELLTRCGQTFQRNAPNTKKSPLPTYEADDQPNVATAEINVETSDPVRAAVMKENADWAPPSLFAFEYCPTSAEREELTVWDTLLAKYEVRDVRDGLPNVEIVSGSTLPAAMPHTSEVLRSIEGMASRDEGREQTATEELRRQVQEDRVVHKDHKAFQEHQDQLGLLAFDTFTTHLDRLVAPTEKELDVRRTIAVEHAQEAKVPDCSAQSVKHAAVSLEVIKRMAERERFMAQREAQEHRRMRAEDARIERIHREQMEHLEKIREAMAHCVHEFDREYLQLRSSELSSYQDLCNSQQEHLALSRQAESLRHIQATKQMTTDIMVAYDLVKCLIEDAECAAYGALKVQQQTDRHTLDKLLAERRLVEEERKRTEEAARLRAFEVERDRRMSLHGPTTLFILALACDKTPSVRSYDWERLKVLEEEAHESTRWVRSEETMLSTLTGAIDEELTCRHAIGRKSHQQHLKLQSSSRPTTATSSPRMDSLPVTGICLDSSTLERLIAQSVAEAKVDPFHAAYYFQSLSCALENISSVNFLSLGSAELQTERQDVVHRHWAREHGVLIAPLVRDLDLGNNCLNRLSLVDLLKTFPNLVKLKVNDNNMDSLDERAEGGESPPFSSLRGVVAAQQNALAERTCIKELDISSNHLDSVAVVGKYLLASLTCLIGYANRITQLHALGTCTRLQCVELNRNKIENLEGLGTLSLLQVLNLGDNNLTHLDTVECNPILRSLYVSHNAISYLPRQTCHLVFLNQLFINHNHLTVIPKNALMWVPLLTVFHAESNALEDISGLSHCLRLRSLNISFNRLKSVESLSPLFVCRKLSSLDISENPMYAAGDGSTPLEIKTLLIQRLPALRELNKEPVTNTLQTNRSTWDDTLYLLFRGMASHLDAYANATHGATVDCLLTDLEVARDTVEICSRRRQRAAQAVEEQLRERLQSTHREYIPALHRLSSQVENQAEVSQLTSTLFALRALRESTPLYKACNRHVTSPLYAERCRMFTESRARRRLTEWMYGCGLIRRARRQLQQLRATYQKTEGFRRERAARRIQSLWRGAALRSRLQRILHLQDEHSDEELEKVEVNFAVPALEDYKSIGQLLQTALLSKEDDFPRFVVPEALRAPSEIMELPRSGSAPTQEQLQLSQADGVGLKNLPLGRLRPSSENISRPVATTPHTQLEAEWGSTIAAQIERKKKKMNRAHQENMRQEFMLDPLNARKQMYSGGVPRKQK